MAQLLVIHVAVVGLISVALKYCCQINGFSSLNLTKLDVLSELPEIRLGVSYRKIGGQVLDSFPADLNILEQLQVCHFRHHDYL